MKLIRIFVSILSISALTACGGGNAETSSTTLLATTTTLAPDCSETSLSTAAAEATYVIGCAERWAGLQLKSQECGEHCYGYIYKWAQAKWNLLGMCSQYSLILPENNSCEGMTGTPKDRNFTGGMTEFPPKEIACQIWDAHRFSENLALTGCTPAAE